MDLLFVSPYIPPKEGCPIHLLPNELLSYIFEIGTRDHEEFLPDSDDEAWTTEEEEWATEEEGEEGEEVVTKATPRIDKGKGVDRQPKEEVEVVDEDEIERQALEKVLPFQVLVSHVCRSWRDVSLSTPTLWTSIKFDGCPPFERCREYLKRSGTAPIDVKIDAEDIETVSDAELYMNELFYDPYLRAFKTAIELVLPHVPRWRSFELMTTDFEQMHHTLRTLSECPGAPLLESLELYHEHGDYDDEFDEFAPIELREPRFTLFNGNVPLLGGLALWGVHLDWTASLPIFRRCIDLELGYHTSDVRPTFKQFAELLSAAPQLATLTLCMSGPTGRTVQEWITSYTEEDVLDSISRGEGGSNDIKIHLPNVKSLTLAYEMPDYTTALMARLSVPKLEKLVLDFAGEDYTSLVQHLLSPSPDSRVPNTSIFYNLTDLKIGGLTCRDNVAVLMFRELRNIRSLNFNFNLVNVYWLPLLGNWMGTTTPIEYNDAFADEWDEPFNPPAEFWTSVSATLRSTEASATPLTGEVFCPRLVSFTSMALPSSRLRWFVERRREMGVPLKELMMEETDELEEGDEMWFNDNLEKFDLFEASDDDLSDNELPDDMMMLDTDEEDGMFDDELDEFVEEEEDENELDDDGF